MLRRHGGGRLRWLEAIRDELRPLRHRSAFSLRVPVFFLPIALASQVLADRGAYGGSAFAWAVAGLVGFGALVAGFALVGGLARRRLSAPGPLAVLSVFALLGLGRSLTVGLAAVSLDLVPQVDVAYRLVGGLVFSPALLGVIAIAVCRHDEHRAIVAELDAKRTALRAAERMTEADFARSAAELAGAVRAAIEPALRAADDALDAAAVGAPGGPARAALLRLIDNDLRPLSRRLAAETPNEPSAVDRAAGDRPVRVPLPERFAVARAFRPGLAAVLLAASVSPVGVRDLSPETFGILFLFTLAYGWTVLSLTRRLVGRLELSTPGAVAFVGFVHALVGFGYVSVLAASGFPALVQNRTTGVIIAAIVGTMTTVAPIVGDGRAATQSDLAAVTERLEMSIGILRRRTRTARLRLARVVHGSLQGALYAAAVRLSGISVSGDAGADLVESVRADITAALARLDARGHRGGPPLYRVTIDEIAGSLGGRHSVSASVDPAVADALALDPDADEAVAEVVREAVNNAVRHGSARTIEIELAMADAASEMSVVVRDDGLGWPGDASPGLGSSLFDELCRAWGHRSDDGGGTVFEGFVILA